GGGAGGAGGVPSLGRAVDGAGVAGSPNCDAPEDPRAWSARRATADLYGVRVDDDIPTVTRRSIEGPRTDRTGPVDRQRAPVDHDLARVAARSIEAVHIDRTDPFDFQ